MKKRDHFFRYFAKAGFVRSVFFRVLSIFIIASVAIAAIAFSSFTSEIRKNVLTDRQKHLCVVEETISKRMDEITSIAYNIGTDPAFYLEPLEADQDSGYEMSQTLARYLVGNSFIEHLAYYRLSEPDKIYISSGERSLSEFFTTSFGMDKATAAENIRGIQGATKTQVMAVNYGKARSMYFAYLYPLPQLSIKPQAFVLMLIPLEQVTPLFDALLSGPSGEVAVFDANGKEIYRMGELDDGLALAQYVGDGVEQEQYISIDKEKYVLQKVVSSNNGWT